jgi:hypothetical protein
VALCKAEWFEIDQSLFKQYAFSANKTLLFCPVCGTPMFFLYSKRGGYVAPIKQVFTGTLSVDPDIALFRIMNHINVLDTIDGGASVWMTHPNADGTPARRWLQGVGLGKGLPVDWPATLQKTPAATTTEATTDDTKTMAAGNRTARTATTDRKVQRGIPMRCHCGGFSIRFKPFSILFQPDLANIDGRFVDPSSKQVLAALDGCNNSRLTSGVDIFPWIYTPRSFVEFATGDLDSLVEWKVLTKYPRKGKNDDACYFCSVCSATVAYTNSTEPSMIALAAGLLGSDTGARAEDVLVWDLKLPIAYKEDGIGGWRERMVQRIEDEAGLYMDGRGIDLSGRRAEWLKLWKDTRSPDDSPPSLRTRLG